MTLEQLEKEAEKLSEKERIELAERIIVSVQMDPEIQAAWIAEAERRWEDLKAGRIEAIPADTVLKSIRERLYAKRSIRSAGEA